MSGSRALDVQDELKLGALVAEITRMLKERGDDMDEGLSDEIKDMVKAQLEQQGGGWRVDKCFGGNNLNIVMRKEGQGGQAERVVVRLNCQRQCIETAIQQLSSESGRPAWLAQSYYKQYSHYQPPADTGTQEKRPNLNAFPTHNNALVEVMEYIPSSLLASIMRLHPELNTQLTEQQIAELHNGDKWDHQAILKEVCSAGMQISQILSALSRHDIIWTDLKAENLLVNPQGDIIISDLKAFVPVAEVIRTYKTNDASDINASVVPRHVTDSYNSSHFRNADIPDASAFKGLMEKEYSFQLASTLYYVAAGQVECDKKGRLNMNLELGVFNKTPEGRRLKMVIERLADDDPKKRFHHGDAAKLLQVIHKEDEFQAMYRECLVRTRREAHKAMVTKSPSASSGLAGVTRAAVVKKPKTRQDVQSDTATPVVDKPRDMSPSGGSTMNVLRALRFEQPQAAPSAVAAATVTANATEPRVDVRKKEMQKEREIRSKSQLPKLKEQSKPSVDSAPKKTEEPDKSSPPSMSPRRR